MMERASAAEYPGLKRSAESQGSRGRAERAPARRGCCRAAVPARQSKQAVAVRGTRRSSARLCEALQRDVPELLHREELQQRVHHRLLRPGERGRLVGGESQEGDARGSERRPARLRRGGAQRAACGRAGQAYSSAPRKCTRVAPT